MKYNDEKRMKYYEAEKILKGFGFEQTAFNHRVSYKKEGFPFSCKVNLYGGPLIWFRRTMFERVTFEEVFENFSEEEQSVLVFNLELFK